MNVETLAALKGSIRKWECIRDQKVNDWGVNNCPLCQLFNNNNDDKCEQIDCVGCPVYEKTKKEDCGDTPYKKFTQWLYKSEGIPYNFGHYHTALIRNTKLVGELKQLAQDEIDFLISLLPKENE